jgi:hypothetical protein
VNTLVKESSLLSVQKADTHDRQVRLTLCLACRLARTPYNSAQTQRKLSDHQRFVQTLHRIEPSIAVGGSLARNFLGLIHRRDLAGFDQWLERRAGRRSCQPTQAPEATDVWARWS